MGCSIKFFLLIKIFNISQTRTFYDKISLPHIRNILVFTDKQTDKQKNSKNKKCHDTPSIHTNIVCKFELSILSTFREKLGHTHRHTDTTTKSNVEFYSIRDCCLAKWHINHVIHQIKITSSKINCIVGM